MKFTLWQFRICLNLSSSNH